MLLEFRNEIIKIVDFYSNFSTKYVNVLIELDSFLKAPLKYYIKDHFVIFKPLSYYFEETIAFDVERLVYKSSSVASNQVI